MTDPDAPRFEWGVQRRDRSTDTWLDVGVTPTSESNAIQTLQEWRQDAPGADLRLVRRPQPAWEVVATLSPAFLPPAP